MATQLPFLYDYVFPNYILPNAIITELGIVNYLHSLNSDRLGPHSFFDQQLNLGSDVDNPLTFLFGNSLGTFPNVTGGSGTHLTSQMYRDLVNCIEESLYLGKLKYPKYIYPIRMSPHIDSFAGFDEKGRKTNGEFFWKHMSASAIRDAKEGRCLIFLDLAQENFIEKSSYENIHNCINASGIPKEQILLAFNSFNAEERYNSFFPEEERKLVVKNWPFVLNNTSYYYKLNTNARLDIMTFYLTKNKIRENYFLFKARRPRPHRQILLYRMHNEDLLDKGDWSWLSKFSFDEHAVEELKKTYNFELDNNKLRTLFEKLPRSLKHEPNGTFDNTSSWTDRQFLSYINSYFYICTETYTHYGYKSVTEKVCKPMVNFLPFLFVSFPGALELLRSLGFKTFSPFIDESYDSEIDEAKRFDLIFNEIKKICSKSKKELHDWYWSMESILIHNHKHVLEFYKNDNEVKNLVNYLESKIK